ncbi:MAG: 50S ribosomal protein L11 methyltransferase, partial [Anaerolineales bacterium]
EVSLTVDGESAEAVAEVLARFAPQGVAIESTAIAPDPESQGHSVGPLRVCAYLPVDREIEATRRRLEEALWHLGRIRPLPQAQFRPLRESNWVETWKQHYQPVPIGERLIIVPAWIEASDEARISIRIEPGMAFGTGTHPTTQLCLEMLESIKFTNVIDVGCGSGILTIAALKLGAECALAVDTDPQAIASARTNAALNNVAEELELAVGSIGEIRAGNFSLQRASLVLANILAPVLIRLLEGGLKELVASQGTLILSGILEQQEPEVLETARAHGFDIQERRKIEDWVAFSLTRV